MLTHQALSRLADYRPGEIVGVVQLVDVLIQNLEACLADFLVALVACFDFSF